ncbi:MAG: sulfatase/phosphatase domain-containing protein, partial [Planctomycetota bacterium]
IYWQFGKAKAIRNERFKLVKFRDSPWELYDLKKDPTERVNLADAMPERVNQLREAWETWWANKQ